MAHYYFVTDPDGDLVDLVPFCSDFCHQKWCFKRSLPYGGWNGCYEHDQDYKCAYCERTIFGLLNNEEETA